MMETHIERWLVGTAVLILLLLGAYMVLSPFFIPVAWAIILVISTWPVFRMTRGFLGGRDGWAAMAMTSLLILAVVGPVVFISVSLSEEVRAVFTSIQAWLIKGPPALPPFLEGMLKEWFPGLYGDLGAWQKFIRDQESKWVKELLSSGRDIGVILARAGLTILTSFFFFRHGEALLNQTRTVFHRLAGERIWKLLHPIGETVKAVVYGLLLTATARGILGGLAYWVVGLKAPILLGIATGLLALLPFGPVFIWLPSSLWLLSLGAFWQGITLLLWGVLVISWIDNFMHSLFISRATQIPFLLVFFGVMGGIISFGLIGIFLGPVILSVVLTLWREWAEEVQTTEEPKS